MGIETVKLEAAAAAERKEASGLERWSSGKLAAVLMLASVLPYLNTLVNGFVYDDNTQVMNNPYIQSFRYLREIFSTTVWSYIGILRGTNYYRPIMTFGYLLTYQLFGPLAYGFHLVNVLLHAAVVVVLFVVTERIFENRLLALAAALLFALHPIHSESVAWIAAVTDLELTLFGLLTFWFYLLLPKPAGARSGGAQVGMLFCYILALLSKEQALMFPLLATVFEHFYRDDRAKTTTSQKVLRYLNLWLLSVAYVAFRVRFFGAFAPILQRPDLTGAQVLFSSVELAGQYARKLIWPVPLCAFYVFHKITSPFDPRVIAGVLTLALCFALFVFLWRRARLASFGLIWMAATLAPVLNPRWLPGNVFTERYLYLPSVGFCWIVGEGVARLWVRASARRVAWRKGLAIALTTLAGLYLIQAVVRNRDWHDDIVLYTRTLDIQPDSWHIRNNLGGAYWIRGDVKAAERQWLQALKIKQENQIVLANMGLVCTKERRYPEAVKYFQQALYIDPRLTDGHLHLGEVYLDMGSVGLAELQFRATVSLSPLDLRGRNRLGQLYFDQGRLAEAEEQFRRSVESERNATGFDGLGDVALIRGARDVAENSYRSALAVDPFDSHAHFKLGEIYAQAGRISDALREFQSGLLTDPNNADALAALKRLRPQLLDANSPKS